jgi:hypothetical protein
MREDYVRPPIVALARPSDRTSTRRFRIVLTLVLLTLAVLIALVARSLIDSGDGNAQALAPHGGSAGPSNVALLGR